MFQLSKRTNPNIAQMTVRANVQCTKIKLAFDFST